MISLTCLQNASLASLLKSSPLKRKITCCWDVTRCHEIPRPVASRTNQQNATCVRSLQYSKPLKHWRTIRLFCTFLFSFTPGALSKCKLLCSLLCRIPNTMLWTILYLLLGNKHVSDIVVERSFFFSGAWQDKLSRIRPQVLAFFGVMKVALVSWLSGWSQAKCDERSCTSGGGRAGWIGGSFLTCQSLNGFKSKSTDEAPGDGWKENIDYRLHFMRPQRLKGQVCRYCKCFRKTTTHFLFFDLWCGACLIPAGSEQETQIFCLKAFSTLQRARNYFQALFCPAAYGRGPGWIVTKTGLGHGWDDVGTGLGGTEKGERRSKMKDLVLSSLNLGLFGRGRVADSPLHRKTVDPFDDTCRAYLVSRL